jgi:peptidase E
MCLHYGQTLYKYNFIIINGGNPFNLLYHVKKTGAENILLEIGNSDKIIIGISAGALLFSRGVQYIEERDKVSIYRMTDDKSIYFDNGKMIEI